ncbi:UvrD-helicase domain-containing protein [Parasediminibacterium sp. JCM 36343]|uniref:UvrD-helicase domain-containing protein n=1 Tax=Parasediminibacterium sp. JCM 36343 TaxID=3374279 RepID=UPI003978CA0C
MNHSEFLSKPKSMLIAPAGHGKTHLITECLLHAEGRQLVLTHTHAGIASIAEKIRKAKIPLSKFHIETITGYAQKYLQAYYKGADVPGLDDPNHYAFAIEQAKRIIASPLVGKVIKATYSGLFVDEYQDCTLSQHQLVDALAIMLPTRIFGDPLQGIFNFGDTAMSNLEDAGQMGDFYHNSYKLEEPWRWKNINEPLGKQLKEIRADIEGKRDVDIRKYPAIQFIKIDSESDIYNPQTQYYQKVNRILSEKNVLIIHPESSSIEPRKRVISNFKIPITLVEAIDDKDFYNLAKLFDAMQDGAVEIGLYAACMALFSKTELNKWINFKGAVARTKEWKEASQEIRKMYLFAKEAGQKYLGCSLLLRHFLSIKGVRCHRKELLNSLCAALEEAFINKNTAYDSMVEKRNRVRKMGRKVSGRCIGTTLLTKGLEFETVIILNVNKFTSPKNLYVALTRASKKLVVFGVSPIISPKY